MRLTRIFLPSNIPPPSIESPSEFKLTKNGHEQIYGEAYIRNFGISFTVFVICIVIDLTCVRDIGKREC